MGHSHIISDEDYLSSKDGDASSKLFVHEYSSTTLEVVAAPLIHYASIL